MPASAGRRPELPPLEVEAWEPQGPREAWPTAPVPRVQVVPHGDLSIDGLPEAGWAAVAPAPALQPLHQGHPAPDVPVRVATDGTQLFLSLGEVPDGLDSACGL